MQLPIDVKAVIDAATDIEGARTTPLSVSVYIDGTAPGDVVGHVRSVFASASAHTRVTIGYLGEAPLVPFPDDDMAVIVAGLDPKVGAHAAELRAAGVPVMVATTLPQLVNEMAAAAGTPVPAGDVVSPEPARMSLTERGEKEGRSLATRVARVFRSDGKSAGANEDASVAARAASASAAAGASAAVAVDGSGAVDTAEPRPLDAQATAALDRHMGEWIIEACHDKRLAFAIAFPFARRPLSVDAVNATALQNAGVGLVMFIPGADLPVMTLNQAKMLLQIAAAYGEPLGVERVKELAAVVGGAFALRSVARQVVAVVPGLGWAVKAAIGYAGTAAMGRAAIEYFEGGGNVSGLANVVGRARDKAVDAAAFAQKNIAASPAATAAVGAIKKRIVAGR